MQILVPLENIHGLLFDSILQCQVYNGYFSVCRRRDALVAPAINLLNNNRNDFDSLKVGKVHVSS